MAETQEAMHFLDYWRVIRARKEIVIAVFLLVVLTGFLVTTAMPLVYMASALIQVKDERPDVEVWNTEANRYDPLYLRTQFEIIQSEPVLEEVVRRRELDKKLAKAYGYDMLPPEKAFERTVKLFSKSMRVQQYRDTNLIEIRVYLAEPKGTAPLEAALAANMVAQVFREQNAARNRRASEGALKAIEQQLEERRQVVEAAAQKVEEIRQKYQINVLSTRDQSDLTIEKMGLTRLEAERIHRRMEMEDKRATWESIRDMPADQVAGAAHLLIGDSALTSLLDAKRKAEVQYNELQMAALGPNHPDVVRVKSVIEGLQEKIDEALKGLRTGLQANYEAAKAKVAALDAMVEESKATERKSESEGYAEFSKAVEELEHAKKIRDALEIRYMQERIEQNVPRTSVELMAMAKPPDEGDPVRPNVMLNMVLSILLGLTAGVALAYFVEYVDTSVKTVEDVERFMKVPVVAVIPQRVKALIDKGAEISHAEAYRMLRTSLQVSEKFKNGKTLCITSGSVGEGKSLTVFNLAFVCAQLGDRVLIVDSDMHRPRQHKILQVANRPGLANLLIGEATLEAATVKTAVANLWLLPSGRLAAGSIHGLLDTRRMKDLVQEVKARYDWVIFDAPPIIGVSDTSLLVREVDGVLQVIQHRKYPRSVSSRAKDMIEMVGGNLVGVVLNNINVARDYSYYYHYHYYYYPRRERAASSAS